MGLKDQLISTDIWLANHPKTKTALMLGLMFTISSCVGDYSGIEIINHAPDTLADPEQAQDVGSAICAMTDRVIADVGSEVSQFNPSTGCGEAERTLHIFPSGATVTNLVDAGLRQPGEFNQILTVAEMVGPAGRTAGILLDTGEVVIESIVVETAGANPGGKSLQAVLNTEVCNSAVTGGLNLQTLKNIPFMRTIDKACNMVGDAVASVTSGKDTSCAAEISTANTEEFFTLSGGEVKTVMRNVEPLIEACEAAVTAGVSGSTP